VRTIGVDTGGTFTDLVLVDGGRVQSEKLPSTPDDPSRAVLAGIASLGGAGAGTEVVHGTTVALNAILTGNVARTALVTNAGFRDLIEIGRQDRPELYALHPEKPRPLVPRELRFELDRRDWPGRDGKLECAREPTPRELELLARAVARSGAQSVAVCLLHSYADPSIEEAAAARLEQLGLPVTRSAGILREYREVERFSTACVNAALVPLMRRYLERLQERLPDVRLSILQSNGGSLAAARAALEPARVLFSGPAGGVVGAARAAREAGLERIVTLDMGGTSTDVAFHSARSRLQDSVSDARIAGLPVALPALDVHTIGCGGGSKVRLDAGGILHVGPESAGADPGPVCHGRGGDLTVTDAHALLGHIAEGAFVGGRLPLDIDAVARGFEQLGRRLGAKPAAAAQAVLDVARAAMRRALGTMTMQRGHDPRDLPLVAFGGAGGLHAAALAEGLGLRGALVPRMPGCLSAFGMASADAILDASRTVLAPLASWPPERRRRALERLTRAGEAQLLETGHAREDVRHEYSVDLRYEGQSFEIPIAERSSGQVAREFHRRHEELYGWQLPGRAIELVNLRARSLVRVRRRRPARPRLRELPASAIVGERRALFNRPVRAAVVDGASLRPGEHFPGPALVEEFSGTTLVPPGWTASVSAGGHLWLAAADPRASRGPAPAGGVSLPG